MVNDIQGCARNSQRGALLDTLKSDDVLCDAAEGWMTMMKVQSGQRDAPWYSDDLLNTLGVTGQQLQVPNALGYTPDMRLKKHLQATNKKAYYEYCTLFKEENLMEHRQEQDLPKVRWLVWASVSCCLCLV